MKGEVGVQLQGNIKNYNINKSQKLEGKCWTPKSKNWWNNCSIWLHPGTHAC